MKNGVVAGLSALKAPWRIGIDVGGTFTDLVLTDSGAVSHVVKVPSMPADPSQGVLAALERLAGDLDCAVEDVLRDCALFVHGSTVATNRMLEGKGAKVGLLTTEGFRDALEIRRGLREDQWNHRKPFAPVLVPRYLRHGVGGRIDPDGSEHAPLVAEDIDAALTAFEAEDVEAVAIAFFNSFLNDKHEAEAAAQVRHRRNDAWVTTSAALSPMMGEYERTSTAVVNATLAPGIVTYLRNLDVKLRELGLSRPLLLVQSNGGAISVDQVAPRPVNLLLSGPAAAVGALNYYRHAIDGSGIGPEDAGNLISMEIGGTSCDVMLMSRGEVAMKDDLMIAGYHVSIPSIDIHTIGAGGGTIAGVDPAGMLYVGPQGAGAHPGPACYGLGGTEPTVTDAQLVLGPSASRRLCGLRPVSRPGRGPQGHRNARGAAARTVGRGRGGGHHCAARAEPAARRRIHLHRAWVRAAPVYIGRGGRRRPDAWHQRRAGARVPAGLRAARCRCAYARSACCTRTSVRTFRATSKASWTNSSQAISTANWPNWAIRPMQHCKPRALVADQVVLERAIDLHYRGQLWSIRVPLAEDNFNAAATRRAFEAEYQRLYGHIQPDGVIMAASLRVAARAATGTPKARRMEASARKSAGKPDGSRPVWHDKHGWLDTAIYDGSSLGVGDRVSGPGSHRGANDHRPAGAG